MVEFLGSIYMSISLMFFQPSQKNNAPNQELETERQFYVTTYYNKKFRETWDVYYLSNHLEMIF